MNKFQPSGEILIGGKAIGEKQPVYFIAEIGSNFDGNLSRAKELIFRAKESGADAAKFQHYTASSLVNDLGFKKIINANSHQSQWKRSVFETYEDASINVDWTGRLEELCTEAEISFLTSPYSFDLVDLVNQYVKAYKVGSGDITWIDIIEHMALKKKPIILATGASSLIDVQRAVDAILNITPDLILLQCNTNYTANSSNFSHIQLNVINEYRKYYPRIITGLSDHMPGHVPVLGAVALGAKVIEKHFTDSVDRPGPDHAFSMTPSTFKEMVLRTRELENSLGDGHKKVEKNELETVVLQQRSVYASKNLKLGERIKMSDLKVLRPCLKGGIKPFEMQNLIGKILNRDIVSGESIRWECINYD